MRAKYLIALLFTLFPAWGWALDWGTASFSSASSKAGYVELELRSPAYLNTNDVHVQIATPQAFAAAGLPYARGVSKMRIELHALPPNGARVRLHGVAESAAPSGVLLTASDSTSLSLAVVRIDPRARTASITPIAPYSTTPNAPTPTRSAPPQEAAQAVLAWAQAWGRGDVETYLAAYVSDYAGTKHSHAQWVAERRARITEQRGIYVTLRDVQYTLRADTVVATFTQQYTSNSYADTVRKELSLRLVNGQWRIATERQIPSE